MAHTASPMAGRDTPNGTRQARAVGWIRRSRMSEAHTHAEMTAADPAASSRAQKKVPVTASIQLSKAKAMIACTGVWNRGWAVASTEGASPADASAYGRRGAVA